MSTKNRISKALSVLLPAGAVGASFLLALSSAQAATTPEPSANASVDRPGVAARLEAIRAGITEDQTSGGALVHTWWGNGGWHNWNNAWHNYWHNN